MHWIAEFSAEDFSGIRDVGVGSTHNGPSTVGRFGKGALTMLVDHPCPYDSGYP